MSQHKHLPRLISFLGFAIAVFAFVVVKTNAGI